MYMPYLHGKQEELLAVAELSPTLPAYVVPIIKPVNTDATRTANRLARIAANARVSVITNSDRGPNRRPPTYAEVVQMLGGPVLAPYSANLLPAFEIRAGTPISDFEAFCRQFSGQQCVVIHKRHTYGERQLERGVRLLATPPAHVFVEPGVAAAQFASLPGVAHIVLRDGFIACERNQDYPNSSAFDAVAFEYAARGFQGFGDYCLIGDNYSATGGPARAVALHLSEVSGQTLVTNHFVSTSTNVDTRTMYFEALDALVAFTGALPRGRMNTQGVRQYLQSDVNRRFPNLGPPKRWSTMHHIEMVQGLLTAAPPAF